MKITASKVYDFSVDYRAFGTSNIVKIHKYLKKKMFGLIKMCYSTYFYHFTP